MLLLLLTVFKPSPSASKVGPHVNETVCHLLILQSCTNVAKDPCRREQVDELISMTHA